MKVDLREEIRRLIILGEPICEKLKLIYFPDKKWPKCYKDVAKKFSHLKAITRKFYSYDIKSSDNELEMLRKLIKYSEQDIIEAFDSNVLRET
jgi:hypothetical protein